MVLRDCTLEYVQPNGPIVRSNRVLSSLMSRFCCLLGHEAVYPAPTLLQFRPEGALMQLSALIKELKAEKDLMQRHLAGIDAALAAFAGSYTKPTRKRRKCRQRVGPRLRLRSDDVGRSSGRMLRSTT